jgi:hypothetical protein
MMYIPLSNDLGYKLLHRLVYACADLPSIASSMNTKASNSLNSTLHFTFANSCTHACVLITNDADIGGLLPSMVCTKAAHGYIVSDVWCICVVPMDILRITGSMAGVLLHKFRIFGFTFYDSTVNVSPCSQTRIEGMQQVYTHVCKRSNKAFRLALFLID